MRYKFAIAHPWDMNGPSAEKAMACRVEFVCDRNNIECLHIDAQGYLLDKQYRSTGRHITTVPDVSFIFHHHFSTKKDFDSWAVFALWNPPFIPYDWNPAEYHINNYFHFDDYLSANENGGLAIDHVNMLLQPHDRSFDSSNILFSSLPEEIFLPPSRKVLTDNPRLFYVGMNWEKIDGRASRHADLFGRLDDDECIDFYGPRIASGVQTWKGFKCYRGEIPFDAGQALIKTINGTGVALTISSNVHQKSAIMTNRIFESAAAGAVIIADRNAFVERHFGDSVFMVDNEGDAGETYRQIKQVLAEVRRDPERAYDMAVRSQQIYLEKFSLDRRLLALVHSVEDRKHEVGKQIYARSLGETVDVVLRWYSHSIAGLEEAIDSINRQTYSAIRVIAACDESLATTIEPLLRSALREGIDVEMVPLRIYAKGTAEVRLLSTGDVLVAGLKAARNDYVAFLEPQEQWFSDHLSSLKRRLEDNPDKQLVYTPSSKNVLSHERVTLCARDFPDELTVATLLSDIHFHNRLGRMMSRRVLVDELLADGFETICRFIDQIEAYALLAIALAGKRALFLPRTTYTLKFYEKPPRGMANQFEQCIYAPAKQNLILLTYLKGRVGMNDLAFMRDDHFGNLTKQNRDRLQAIQTQHDELHRRIDTVIPGGALPSGYGPTLPGSSVLAPERTFVGRVLTGHLPSQMPWARLYRRYLLAKARQAARSRDWGTAERYYATLLRLDGSRPRLWRQYGHALREQKSFLAARFAFLTALELSPGDKDLEWHAAHVDQLMREAAVDAARTGAAR
ncbi:MAG: hypothetical protein KGM18_01640 [Sphingomonadales bacterium]|nr:hypothetical protein [Sphingomonadales bacterium]